MVPESSLLEDQLTGEKREKKAIKGWPLAILLAGGALAAGVATQKLSIAPEGAAAISQADTAWMLTATALVLLMTPGLAFFYGGMVSRKHIISTMFQSFIAMGIISVVWVICGFSLAFGDSVYGLIGNPATFFMFKNVGLATNASLSPTIPLVLFALFQMKFAIITPALVTGAFAERIKFSAFVLFMLLFATLIYAPLAHWTWHPDGILRQWGVLDFAGGTVVHMSAGFAGLAGALMIGRRRSLHENESPAPSNIPFVLLGTGLLWFGWFGFNAGSALGANETAALAFLTTNTAAGAAMITWILMDVAMGRKPSAMGAGIGAVVGLVAITPAAGFVNIGSSILIGLIASMTSNLVISFASKKRIDDSLDVFACHGIGGLVGMILTAVFAMDGGLITGQPDLLLKHLAASLLVAVYCFCGSIAIYKVVNILISLRVRETDEDLGLDLSQHSEALFH